MRGSRATWPTACLLLAGMAGCQHKAAPPPPPPPAVKTPPITPATITVITPLPSIPPETARSVKRETPAPVQTATVSKPPPRKHHLRHHPAETSVASNNEPSSPAAASTVAHPAETAPTPADQVPALGQLSTGTALTGRQRDRLLDEIAAQETRLKKQPVSTGLDSRTEMTQIETFLAKARQAVDQNDLDGASTLTTKARVLLDEMEKQ